MDTQILEKIGLNRSEVNVYMTLLDLDQSTTGPIMDKAKVSASKIYGILERLIQKGLVSFIIKGKTKYYSASNPELLNDYLNEREDDFKKQRETVQKLIPTLKAKYHDHKQNQEARIFQGWKGVQNAYNTVLDILPRGSDFIAFVQPSKEEETKSVKLFYQQYHRKRVANNYNTKLISTKDLKHVFTKEPYKSFKKLEVRYVDNCPSGLVIFEDYILHIAFEKNPVAVLIRSKQIAQSYQGLFYQMWKGAARVK